jgi:predicted DNA-binding transcriptional regulator YafY
MENNLQARRVIYITNQLLLGKKLTVNELHEHFVKEYPVLTKRTLQRDMKLIAEIIPILEEQRHGREFVWKIPRNLLYGTTSNYLNTSELLSLYFLKAYLKLFKGTVIEEQANLLTQKIEELAPEEIIPHDILFGDKNFGFYDYSGYDPTIRKIIRLIRQKKLSDIEYQNHPTHNYHSIQAVFQMIFTFSEMLYAIIYVPKHNSHIALSIQNINEIQEKEDVIRDLPEFNFNEWSKERFGVFWGEPVDVEIEIEKDFRHYFENRNWHSSQKFIELKNGNLLLKMIVPIVPDFTAWLMSWGDAIRIKKPNELIIKLKRKFQSALNIYD